GAVTGDRLREAGGNQIECFIPRGRSPGNRGLEQPSRRRQCLAKGGSFGAEPAKIGGMARIARKRAVGAHQKTAAHPPIGAGRADTHAASRSATTSWIKLRPKARWSRSVAVSVRSRINCTYQGPSATAP